MAANTWENNEVTMCGSDVCFNGLIGQYARRILSFGEDVDGKIQSGNLSTTDTTGIVTRS